MQHERLVAQRAFHLDLSEGGAGGQGVAVDGDGLRMAPQALFANAHFWPFKRNDSHVQGVDDGYGPPRLRRTARIKSLAQIEVAHKQRPVNAILP